MAIYTGNKKCKLFIGNKKIKKAYLGSKKVYSSGNIATYYVDSGVSYREELDEGKSCLSPKTFTPAKSGYTFIGWREDKTAASSVLTGKVMGDNPVTLYAVFRQTITLSYAGNGNTGGSTAAQSGYRYYNNGNVANPSFTVKANGFTRTGYLFTGWKSGSTSYAVGQSVTLSSNLTLTAQWYTAAVTNFAYTGGIQTYTVPVTGLYLLTAIGAGGGGGYCCMWDGKIEYGGEGGVTNYYASLIAGQTLYIVVGGGGISTEVSHQTSTPSVEGGYNGGGNSGEGSVYGGGGYGICTGSGGGATHIATKNGLLSSLSNSISNILCVAGGGGGGGGGVRGPAGHYYGDAAYGGVGGGITGGDGTGGYGGSLGGTQTAGPFGAGENGNILFSGGHGGGYHGGYSTGNAGGQDSGGGGGSGYIPTNNTVYNGKSYTSTTSQGGGGKKGSGGWWVDNVSSVNGGNGSASIQLITV